MLDKWLSFYALADFACALHCVCFHQGDDIEDLFKIDDLDEKEVKHLELIEALRSKLVDNDERLEVSV
jgi:hypothetical protein